MTPGFLHFYQEELTMKRLLNPKLVSVERAMLACFVVLILALAFL